MFTQTARTAILVLLAALVLWSSAAADDRLVVHLSFDKLSAGGSVATDTSGRENHGKLNGQVTAAGIVGKALKFEGYPEQVVEFEDLELTAPATVAFWLKTKDLVNDRRLLSQSEGAATQAGSMRLMGQFEVWPGEGDWQGVVTQKIRHDTWMHLAVVFDSKGGATGYLNGEAQQTVRCGFHFSGVKAAIGGPFLGQHGAAFAGLLDDFRIYARALSPKDVSQLYHQVGNTR